jgi:hypothetical protein
MKTYRGNKVENKREVAVNGERLTLRNHPNNDLLSDQFGDSDETSQNRNLAYSILGDAIGEDAANLICEDFRQSIVENLNPDRWELTDEDVREYSRYLCAAGFEAQQPWEDVSAGPSRVSTLPAFPRIVMDPNYHLRQETSRMKEF